MDAVPIPKITLHILRGRASQKSRAMVGATLLIGSDAKCDVQMRSAAIAQRHCLITRRDGKAFATRLSADHHVLLNGQSVAEQEITHGDTLALGPFELRVEFNGVEAVVAAPSTAVLKTAEPPLVHRPRFALLDRKPAIAPPREIVHAPKALPAPDPMPTTPVDTAAAERIAEQADELTATADRQETREQELRGKDERLQEWAKRLDMQEADLERNGGELAAALEECQRRRKTLEARRERLALLRVGRRVQRREMNSRFANLIGDVEQRAKELGQREAEITGREERWQRLADALDVRQAAVAERERQAVAALDDLDRQRAALRRERALLDKEWQRLFARQQDVAQEQEHVAKRAERVAVEESLLAESRQRSQTELRTLHQLREQAASRTAGIDAQSVKLRGRERALDERAQQITAADQQLRQREHELSTQAEEIQRQAAEVQERLDAEQRSIDERRVELDAERGRLEEEKQALQERQTAWKAEVESLSKAKEELDQRVSLLAAGERALAELETKGHDPAELERRFKDLRREQDKVAADAVAAADRRRKLDAETTKLAEVARELAERQRQLTEHERELAEAAARGQEELDREAERLQERQKALDAQAADQNRRWERLKTSAARIGGRRKVLLERLSGSEARFEECKREIAALVESRRRLRMSLEEYALQAEQREKEALDWLRGVRARSEAVADAHRRFTRQFDAAVGNAAPTSLRASLGDWSHRMGRLQQSLNVGERVLRSATLENPTPGDALPSASERPHVTPKSPLPTPHSSSPLVPPKWLFKLVELGLADEEVVNYLLVNARERKAPVEDALVEQGVVTSYQLSCVSEGRLGDLEIGPAMVLDLVHRGVAATTYQAIVPPFEKAIALRLLHPNTIQSEVVKAAYMDHVRGAMRFRHPSAAGVLGPFDHDGRTGSLYEFVPGRPLPEASKAMTPPEIVGCFRQCLATLFAGQQAGMLHRGLRPSRVIVAPMGRAVLLGFGEPDWLVRLHRSEKGADADHYGAPEERTGRPVDGRADLFALCRIFLEVVLGRRPEPGESVTAPSGYPDALLELLLRGVQGEPAARCRSFAEVIHAVDRLPSEGFSASVRAPSSRAAA